MLGRRLWDPLHLAPLPFGAPSVAHLRTEHRIGLALCGLLLAPLGPGPCALPGVRLLAQQPVTIAPAVEPVPVTAPPDTYGDRDVEDLLGRARESRAELAEGLQSWEGRMWERTYIGLGSPLFRRERGLFDQQRVSRIRWTAEGERIVRWEGARRSVPIAGASSARSSGMATSLAENLAGRPEEGTRAAVPPQIPPPLAFDPASDRLAFGGEWALNPLADTAVYHYRYLSGDTLRISLPQAEGERRVLTLAEVRVEPRRAEFRLVSASLWFEVESGALVRAGYRPARPFDIEVDGTDDGDAPPGFMRPIRAEIRYVTVDHGLYDLAWWIPRRFTFEGEAQVTPFARFPITIEWEVDEVWVNQETELIPEVIPEGWTYREVEVERDGELRSYRVLVPPATELARSPELRRLPRRGSSTFSPEELAQLERILRFLGPPFAAPVPSFAWGLQEGMTRYNRIEGLSTGVAGRLDFSGRLELRGEVRYAFSEERWKGEAGLRRGVPGNSESIAIYRRLDPSSEWERGLGLGSSLSAALWGGGRTPFHHSEGIELLLERTNLSLSPVLRIFHEGQSTAVRSTHAHLQRLWTDHTLAENPEATAGSWTGGVLQLRYETGGSPEVTQAFGALALEGGGGETSYARGWLRTGLTLPLSRRWSSALEGGAGSSLGTLPLQRRFYPGGPAIYRGAGVGELVGEAFWFARMEVGPGVPAARLVVFLDLLEVGSRAELGQGTTHQALGVGASFLDGLLRMDLARELRGGLERNWRFHLYLDGLF